MPLFSYRGRDTRGDLVRGTLDGSDSGAIQAFDKIASINIGGSMHGDGTTSGGVYANQVGTVHVVGSVEGGAGEFKAFNGRCAHRW